jgi:hypothetical protein
MMLFNFALCDEKDICNRRDHTGSDWISLRQSSDQTCCRWESTMGSIEDRVDIALSDKSRRRSSGDAPYWDLLKNVRYARKFYVIADPEQRRAWSHAYITCEAHAHTVALEGIYFDGDGGCGTAIDAATRP